MTQKVTICCEFTPRQLDLIQAALDIMWDKAPVSCGQEFMDTWNAVRTQRAYGRINKRPGERANNQSAENG